jgi:Ca2+-binding EF-hand superfamily protein
MGLVSKETNTLTLQNIRTALSNDLNADVDIDKLAKAIFELLDENENGNIQFEEFASLTVGVGKARRNTYKALSDVNHSLNTFDWVLCIILAVAMIFFICKLQNGRL